MCSMLPKFVEHGMWSREGQRLADPIRRVNYGPLEAKPHCVVV